MSLFSSSRSSSNTYNTSNSRTQTRDIGFTGQQGVNVLNTLSGTVRDVSGKLADTYDSTLRSLGNNYESSLLAGYQLAEFQSAQSYQTVRDIGAQSSVTLNNLIGGVRDFAQRAISGSTGQDTPLQTITPQDVPSPTIIPVGNVQGGSAASSERITLILAIAGVAIALYSVGGKK